MIQLPQIICKEDDKIFANWAPLFYLQYTFIANQTFD